MFLYSNFREGRWGDGGGKKTFDLFITLFNNYGCLASLGRGQEKVRSSNIFIS